MAHKTAERILKCSGLFAGPGLFNERLPSRIWRVLALLLTGRDKGVKRGSGNDLDTCTRATAANHFAL